ncbi:hypothetical protein EYC98_20785 [Halieaceae bacterium IMCC14734]|uniref:Uncharacterized protein n=1 Tax=Candidatus Litorirhabdus singularis TaxID=2518993 RepID=A0ABT3TLX8_9GAMM|nr:hypothetical protein [Candidatus Litorirhabdus singularis]MCX2983305.1 hypothetical protein [Candidatus Litorirhabdus singularis]
MIIVGRNGIRKLGLLKVLSGIYRPDKCRMVNGARKTSLLTLQAGFDVNLKGRDNVRLNGMLLGYKKVYILSKLAEIAEFSELEAFFHAPIKTSSTGMRVRLGLATASF